MRFIHKKKSKTLPEAKKYLVAYLLYNDGIQTVIAVSAIFATVELEMSATNLIMVILMIHFVAFFGSLGFEKIAERLGAKNAILLSLLIWSACVVYSAVGMNDTAVVLGMEQRQLEFWFLGFVIALVMGGSQASAAA